MWIYGPWMLSLHLPLCLVTAPSFFVCQLACTFSPGETSETPLLLNLVTPSCDTPEITVHLSFVAVRVRVCDCWISTHLPHKTVGSLTVLFSTASPGPGP